MSWAWQFFVVVLGSCSVCSGAPAVKQVRTKKQWTALIDAPTGGSTRPATGTFMRSSSTSVVTCTSEKWIKEAFATVAEQLQDRFQFLRSEDRNLCREISLRDDRIGLVTSIYQSSESGTRDLKSLDLREQAADLRLATLPPRMARANLHQFVASAELPLVGFLTIDSMLSEYDKTRPLLTLFCPFNSVSAEIDPQKADSRVMRQAMFARSPQAAWCRAPLVAAMKLLSATGSESNNLTATVAEIEEHRQLELHEFGYEDLDGVGVGARTSTGFKYRLEPTDKVPTAAVLADFARNVMQAENQGENGTGVVSCHRDGDEQSPHILRPYLKSAPIPRTSKKAAIQIVVGETFHDAVTSANTDVLIALYAPWCEACPRVLSELKATAASLRKTKAKKIKIAQFDITANDAPKRYRVDEVPTIYWAPVESKQAPEKYRGDLTARAFQSYLCQKRAAVDRPLPDRFGCHEIINKASKEL